MGASIKLEVAHARSRGESIVSSYGPGRPSIVEIMEAAKEREEKRWHDSCNGWCIAILVVAALTFGVGVAIAIGNPQWFGVIRDTLQGRDKLDDSHEGPDMSKLLTSELAPAPCAPDPELGIIKPTQKDKSLFARLFLCCG